MINILILSPDSKVPESTLNGVKTFDTHYKRVCDIERF